MVGNGHKAKFVIQILRSSRALETRARDDYATGFALWGHGPFGPGASPTVPGQGQPSVLTETPTHSLMR